MADGNDRGARKQQIVEGAFRALMSNGLPPLSLDVIAAESGLTRQLIRYHFPTHESLMESVCDYLAARYSDVLTATAGQLDGPQRVEMFLDFYFDLLDGAPKPRDDQVYDAMLSLATGSPAIRENLQRQYGLLGQVLAHEFAIQYPALKGQAAAELSWLFVALMYGHWKMVASLGFSDDHRRVTRRAMDRLIRSYLSQDLPLVDEMPVWRLAPQAQ